MKKNDIGPHFFEQYKLAVEMADRVSARRMSANAFFITVNGALATFMGFMVNRSGDDNMALVFFCAVGLVLAYSWWLLIRSYRDLNSAKWSVILDMEKQIGYSPFGDEWQYLKKDPVKKWRKRYAELTSVEKNIPIVFACMYLFILIVTIF